MATMINIEPRLEADAAQIFGKYGLTFADAVTKILLNVVATGTLPSEVKNQLSRDEAAQRLKANVAYLQEQSVLNGNSEMTLDEINEIIAEVRKEGRQNDKISA